MTEIDSPYRLPPGAFRVRVPIRFSHTDPAGIVYFPNYFDMFNALVEDWVNMALGLDYATLILTNRRGLPIVHAECDFLRPSRMGETLTLGVVVERLGTSSIAIRIIGEHEGEERSEPETRLVGKLVLVSMSLDTHRAIPIPDDLRTAIEGYISACRG
jgi:4-hydroxybenzoyl-CoA thioesterase